MSHFLPPIREGQGLESYLDCAAAISGATRASLLDHLAFSHEYPKDLDLSFDSSSAKRLWKYLEKPTPLTPPLIDVGAKAFYCPLCFVMDMRLGKFPYFRLRWRRPFTTHCSLHKAPLFTWAHISGGQRLYPKKLVEKYMGSSGHIRQVKGADAFDYALHLSRSLLKFSSEDYPGAYWIDQCNLESALSVSASTSQYIYGMDSGQARRVVSDLATFLLSNFSPRRSPPLGAHAASFLGPRWLYGTLGSVEPSQLCRLDLIEKPERKRTAIALASRVIFALRLDPSLDADTGRLIEAGETSLVRDFEKSPREGIRWLRSRFARWPVSVAKLMNSALPKDS